MTLPVFGTEEALVEPMLLARDTTVPLRALSAKKPRRQTLHINDEKFTDITYRIIILTI